MNVKKLLLCGRKRREVQPLRAAGQIERGWERVKKTGLFFRCAALLLACGIFLSACSLELSDTEIRGRMNKIAETLPATTIDQITLSQTMSEGGKAYSAAVQLTWSGQEGRFSTEKALNLYSRTFADEVMVHIPNVALLSLSWVVPFHAEDEAAMIYSFQRRKDGMAQTGLSDRFTDGTFGADAFIDPNAKVDVSVRRVERDEEEGEASPEDGTADEQAGDEKAAGEPTDTDDPDTGQSAAPDEASAAPAPEPPAPASESEPESESESEPEPQPEPEPEPELEPEPEYNGDNEDGGGQWF